MNKLKKLPIGKQDFASLINSDCIYIDKTQYLYNLINDGFTYFLSRPRRFGKSLTVSTLKEIFLGNKELFKDTWIYNKIEWEKYPVIYIDFSEILKRSLPVIDSINFILDEIASEYNIQLTHNDYGMRFRELIKSMAKEKPVVILIDEYDKPIIDYLEKEKLQIAHENREILKNFYSVLKGSDENIKFLFITGVSKFSKVSIFSDLNHLNDITLDYQYATMLGYTEKEIENYFEEYIQTVIDIKKLSKHNFKELIKKWYNGYCWHPDNERVYNPFSILNFFSKKEFKNFWFSTGTPTFIVKYLNSQKTLPEQTGKILVNQMFFDKFDISNLDIYSLMFQTGYLTIKSSNNNGAYQLGYPNYEVKNSFMGQLLECYSHSQLSITSNSVENIKIAIDINDWYSIIHHLNILFSKIPYQIFKPDAEFFYHAIIHTTLSLIGIDIISEMQTSKGRIDTIIKTDKFIYIVEFKIGDAKTAILQIKENEYYKPFINDTRALVLVGIGFDVKEKAVKDYITEIFKQ